MFLEFNQNHALNRYTIWNMSNIFIFSHSHMRARKLALQSLGLWKSSCQAHIDLIKTKTKKKNSCESFLSFLFFSFFIIFFIAWVMSYHLIILYLYEIYQIYCWITFFLLYFPYLQNFMMIKNQLLSHL